MLRRQCHHCKEWIEEGAPHDCWTTTEEALTRDLVPELRDAWERLRETAGAFGEQRIYASGKAIMFSRRTCYFLVRPKTQCLELCAFLGRAVKAPQIRRVDQVSKIKIGHYIRITHRDEVEAPITNWLQEAYEMSDALSKNVTEAASSPGAISEKPARVVSAPKGKAGSRKDAVAQLARVRRICSAIQGTIEKLSHGEPTFFTPKRVFTMFANNHHGDGHVAVWVPAAPGVQAALIEEDSNAYFRPPYVGGAGWVGVDLAKVNDDQLGALIREAYRLVTAKKTPAARPGAAAPARTVKPRRRGSKA
ncbi:MAG TPA: DUF5655 domain-containing protein [Bryobacteraceae bacterium]|nr:DUF5655 domain-containing protein [Bryobacteraceae bacterium]